MTLDLLLTIAALALALALRPWRALPVLPWPALALWAMLPLLWSLDRVSAVPLMQPLAGSGLLLLMLGWPLAVLMLLPVAALMVGMTDLDAWAVLQRVVWLGLVPMTLALGLGAALRRWLPHHLFIYILGRGFLGTGLALGCAGVLSAAINGVPAGLQADEVMMARVLAASGDAFLTGMFVAIFVAFRPHWLATYADRIYLPAK